MADVRLYAYKARKHPTRHEQMVRMELNRRGVLRKFRFQYVIEPFYVDFCYVKGKVIVEIDGSSHWSRKAQQHDWGRTQVLNGHGYEVIRFTNGEVDADVEAVVDEMLEACGLD